MTNKIITSTAETYHLQQIDTYRKKRQDLSPRKKELKLAIKDDEKVKIKK
jgi:hypothetical protein